MKYLFFISFDNGLLHNAIYNSLDNVFESVTQLIEEENLDAKKETVPTPDDLKKHLDEHDDYSGQISNGTWYHIQPYPVFGV